MAEISALLKEKSTAEDLCEQDLSLDLGDTGAAAPPPLAGGRQELSVLRLSKVAAESVARKAAAFALGDAVWKNAGRVPPVGTPSAGLK